MSNMNDAVGLCVPCSEPGSIYEGAFEPATGTLWAYFNPPGLPCYSLELLNAMCAHDQRLVANGGRVDIEGEMQEVKYYVTCSRTLNLDHVSAKPRQQLSAGRP